MRKIFLFLLILVFTGTVFAEIPKRKYISQRQQMISKINFEVEADTILGFLKMYDAKIRRSIRNKKHLSPMKYSSYAFSINMWLKYGWLTADTRLSKKWLKKCYDLLAYLSKIRSYIETAEFNGQTETLQYEKAVEYFNVARKRYTKLIAKPVNVSDSVHRNAQLKKAIWQRGMRKLYDL